MNEFESRIESDEILLIQRIFPQRHLSPAPSQWHSDTQTRLPPSNPVKEQTTDSHTNRTALNQTVEEVPSGLAIPIYLTDMKAEKET